MPANPRPGNRKLRGSASAGVYMLALAAISFAAKVLTGKDITWNKGDIWVVIAYAAWGFVYFACCWAASGRTAGMAPFGVRVVTDDGTAASGRRGSCARWRSR